MALGWLRWRAWVSLGAVVAAAVCVAGVALGDIDRHFAWQASHSLHGSSLCVAGVALMALGWLRWRAWVSFGVVVATAVCVAGMVLGDMDLYFAWQGWHFATWIVTLRRRRGTCGTGLAPWVSFGAVVAAAVCRPSPCVAGVALRDMDRHFAWQAWHLWHWAGPQTTCPHTTCPHTTYSHTQLVTT